MDAGQAYRSSSWRYFGCVATDRQGFKADVLVPEDWCIQPPAESPETCQLYKT